MHITKSVECLRIFFDTNFDQIFTSEIIFCLHTHTQSLNLSAGSFVEDIGNSVQWF